MDYLQFELFAVSGLAYSQASVLHAGTAAVALRQLTNASTGAVLAT